MSVPPVVRKHILVLTFFLLCNMEAGARDPRFELTAGGAFSFVSKKYTAAKFKPMILPCAGILYYKPFSEVLSLKTGLIYQLKGVSTSAQALFDSTDTRLLIEGRTWFHYLNIPLQLAFTIQDKRQREWRAAIGVSYGFLMHASSKGTASSYYKEQLMDQQDYAYPNYVGLTASRDRNRSGDRSELYGFTPSFRTDVSYRLRRGIFIGGFYEYHLNDVSSNAGSSKVNMHYLGFNVGLSLNR